MKKGRGLETNEDLTQAFARFFDVDTDEPETVEEIDAGLRELGYDPDEVGVRMKAAAERALADSPLNWRNRAQKELEDERVKIGRFTVACPDNRLGLIGAIQRLAGQAPGQAVYANRNLESMTDEDLASLLSDLEYLITQKGGQHEK
jgi:hypothetical protein